MGTKYRSETRREVGPGGAIGTTKEVRDFTAAFTAVRVSRSFTVGRDARLALVDATPGDLRITLPGGTQDLPVIIKRVDASGNAVTIGVSGPGTIDGATTYALTGQWSAVMLKQVGNDWFIIGKV